MATATAQLTSILIAAVFLMAFHDGGGGGGRVCAQSPEPSPSPEMGTAMAPATDCMTNILNTSDCLTYVEAGSNLTVPEKPCCGELAGLVESNPICLCELLAKADSFGIKIDLDKAMKLPSVCKVSTPPISTCGAIGIPIGSPSSEDYMSPAIGIPIGSPSSEDYMSPGVQPPGVAATPTTGNNDNGVSSIADSSLAFLVGLAIAFIPTFF